MDRVYFHYRLWEEWTMGMWRNVFGIERESYLKKAIEFTGNHKLYGRWMLKALKLMPYSCLQNLTNDSMNRQAWIGHAATCLAIGCPEDITRLAWHNLTQAQQDKANLQADKAIARFERNYQRGIKLCLKLD